MVNVNISKVFLDDFIRNLESAMILLEDNPQIRDTSEFYCGEEVLGELKYFHKEEFRENKHNQDEE